MKPLFEKHKKFTTLDKAEILQVHEDYFHARQTQDVDLMKAVWLNSADTILVEVELLVDYC